jgi:hypothetical protein
MRSAESCPSTGLGCSSGTACPLTFAACVAGETIAKSAATDAATASARRTDVRRSAGDAFGR